MKEAASQSEKDSCSEIHQVLRAIFVYTNDE